MALANHLLGQQPLTDGELIHADVNMDGERKILDLIALVDILNEEKNKSIIK